MKGKKLILTIALVVAILATAGVGTAYAAKEIAKSSAIGEENARNFAFVQAGISPEQAVVTETEFKYSGGRFVYEIEFTAEGNKYEYTVDSKNGQIIEEEIEGLYDGSQVTEKVTEKEEPAEKKLIGVDKAKEIAIEASKENASSVKVNEARAEKEDGRDVYKIEFVTSEKEYEYEIDAYTGAILEQSSEPLEKDEKPQKSEPAPSGSDKKETDKKDEKETKPSDTGKEDMITLDEAKEKALKKAGLSSKDVKFTKVKIGTENGKKVYEIEFTVAGKAEYEAEIDAYTGEIVDFDIDRFEADDKDDDPDDEIDDDDDDIDDRDDD